MDEINLTQRKVFSAVEYEPVEIPLTDLISNGRLQVYPQVQGKDFFRIYLKKDRLVFQAGGFIGFIPINDKVVLDVKSRVPVRNLERLLRIAEHTPFSLSPHLRPYASHEETTPSLIDLLTRSLVDAIGAIEAAGLHREYFQKAADTSFPRGRVLLGMSVQRHKARGINYRAATSWFESSVDTPPNRCLKYAIWYLARRYASLIPVARIAKIRRDLNQAYHLFQGATLDKTRSFLKDPLIVEPERMPALRSYYKQALYLALTVIRDRGLSFDTSDGELLMPSLLVDLESSFESYLRAVVRTHMRRLSPDIRVLDGNQAEPVGGRKLLFDQQPSESAKPDIVFSLASGKGPTYPLVVEVKYKKFHYPDRNDINQAITYAASYRSRHVVIVHPCLAGGQPGLYVLGTIAPLKIYQYVYDLAAPDPNVEEERFALALHTLIPA